jgi:HD domain
MPSTTKINKIKMRAKTVSKYSKIKPFTFENFLKVAPVELQILLEKAKEVEQSPYWHPEGDVYIHIKIVFNRAVRTNDINMIMAAFFHDLGKIEGTHFTPPAKWSAHGHEFSSARLVEKYRAWIESLGANYDIVYYVVKNHMRVKQIHEMRPSKREIFQKEEYYPFVNQFSDFDNMQIDYSNDID